MTRLRLARIFWIGAAAILVVAALVALFAILRGRFSDTDGRILGTLAALLLAGSTLLTGLALGNRGRARLAGWVVAAVSPVCLTLILVWVWSWIDERQPEPVVWKLGWAAVWLLVAFLVTTTALLLARRPALVRLAYAAGGLAVLAAALSAAAIWSEDPSATLAKALGALWILAALAYFLVPVLERWTSIGQLTFGVRVLASLDDVELVASREQVEGIVVDALPGAGERLILRRRQPGT